MSNRSTKPTVVSSAAQLVQDVTVDLNGVTFYKASAELRDDLDATDPEVGDVVPNYALKMLFEGTEIGIRLNVKLDAGVGLVEVDAAVNYVTPYPVEVPQHVQLEFANNVGIMALVPFIREAIWTLTQRVFGTAVVMPVFQRGELAFSPPDGNAVDGSDAKG